MSVCCMYMCVFVVPLPFNLCQRLYFVVQSLPNPTKQKNEKNGERVKKNPAYGRKSISRPMRIVAPIPRQGGPSTPKNHFFLKNGKNHSKRKNSKMSRDMPKLAIYPLTRGLSSIGQRGFQHVLHGKISKKNNFFCAAI